jgi:4-alpha-glucanotransferase
MDHLQELAELYGIQTSYYEVSGQLRHASPEALCHILRALGSNIENPDGAWDALRARRQQVAERVLEPVHVAWEGTLEHAPIRLPVDDLGQTAKCTLHLDTGEVKTWSHRFEELSESSREDVEGKCYSVRRLPLPIRLPFGYHQLEVEWGPAHASGTVLSAPVRAHEPSADKSRKSWGVFLPLYALHSQRSWGAGDLGDLEELTDWIASMGGGMVATLPLLAAFLDEPFEPGPYSPASRLFWNEFYLNLDRIPELERSPPARRIMESAEFQAEVQSLCSASLVDYRRQVVLKRRILEELAGTLFSESSARRSAFESYVAVRPDLQDYARFRAVGEKLRMGWPAWPASLRDGQISAGDYDPAAERYHLYVQWLADEQLRALAAKARSAGHGLYLDLPLGVNPDSYDVWRYRDCFALGCSAGAPPDPFFAKGQDWGFPPLHPERIRMQGYRYLTAYIRHHLSLAGVLRIDHMMGLHRLYWVPQGLGAQQGVYVRYPAEELYAVYVLESERHHAVLVGEDLGTVPPEVRPAMECHNVHRMYVMQYELQPHNQDALNPVYPKSVASLNTHDMPPFAAFWKALDVDDRLDLGVLDGQTAANERGHRQWLLEGLIRSLRKEGYVHEDTQLLALLRGSLLHMGHGDALVVLANLEDLWLETASQNVPGTWHERPNWQRKAHHSLDEMKTMPQVKALLEELNRAIRS